MKKIIAILLIILISPISALAEVTDNAVPSDEKIALYNRNIIEDELVNSEVFPKVVPVFAKENTPITDDLIVPVRDDMGTTIHLWARKLGESNKVTIEDELITPRFMSRVGNMSILRKYQRNRIEDNLVKANLSSQKIAKVKPKNSYDFSKTQIPVQLKIVKNLSTKQVALEGNSVLFKTIKDVSLNGTFLPKGTQIVGRVETVSESDKMGTPANIVIDNFYVKDNPNINFYGNITKTGANRSLWVYPLYQAGNIVLYVAGFVFVPIHGGHAKLLTSDTYTVFYETGVSSQN